MAKFGGGGGDFGGLCPQPQLGTAIAAATSRDVYRSSSGQMESETRTVRRPRATLSAGRRGGLS